MVFAIQLGLGFVIFAVVVALVSVAVCFFFKICCFKSRGQAAGANRASNTDAQVPENVI